VSSLIGVWLISRCRAVPGWHGIRLRLKCARCCYHVCLHYVFPQPAVDQTLFRVVLQFDHVTVHFLVSHPGHMLLANHFMFLYISIASVDLVNASHLPLRPPL
jgi:hypothetical protein